MSMQPALSDMGERRDSGGPHFIFILTDKLTFNKYFYSLNFLSYSLTLTSSFMFVWKDYPKNRQKYHCFKGNKKFNLKKIEHHISKYSLLLQYETPLRDTLLHGKYE